jgi:hypothetical protein
MQIRQSDERRPRRHPNTVQAGQNRQIIESERLTECKEQKRREFKRKREEHCSNTAWRVNILEMSQAEMRKVRE